MRPRHRLTHQAAAAAASEPPAVPRRPRSGGVRARVVGNRAERAIRCRANPIVDVESSAVGVKVVVSGLALGVDRWRRGEEEDQEQGEEEEGEERR